MIVKYNRTSTIQQDGKRFEADTNKYDLTLFDLGVSGSVPFKQRPKGKELIKLVEEGKVRKVVFEELSRSGRNTIDVLTTLEWLDQKGVNIEIRNIGLQSRPGGKKNPIWKMITSVMSSIYELERDNIYERTMLGRKVFVQRGGRLGRQLVPQKAKLNFLKRIKQN
jgi:DNA invertase Pin-like site-specific DNA recombinase